MYLIKTTYSLLLSLSSIILSYEYPFYPIQLSLISAICVGIPSFFLALEPNYNKVGKDFIVNVFRNALPNGIMVMINIFIIIMFCSIFGQDFNNYRLVVVSLTGLITLRLLYTICKPLNLWRKILLIFCSISFFELLILLPDLFLVSKFGIVSIIFILILGFVDTYVIDFFRELYDKIVNKVRNLKNERKERKEKNKLCVPMGGPFGGNGGKGSDIIFKADEGLKTLIDLRYQKKIKGNNGENGEGKNKFGSNSEDVIIKVPVGTTVKDADTGVVIADLTKQGEMATIAYGGRGGRGNVSLATRSNPCPSYAEKGEPGEVRNIKVELRMIADVGLVGMPSVGKSTILSMISNANPKIADYHFTTLSPNLGVVKTKDNTFVVADLPGLIEGASEGVGLGHKFLKHVERTKIIAHVIDMAGTEGREPYEDYVAIRKELEDFSPKLLTKKEIIIANKMDGEEAKENLKKFKEKIRNEDIYEVTALINDGLDKVIDRLSTLVKEIDREVLYTDDVQESHVLYKFKKEKPFTISKDKDVFVVRGDTIEKLFRMTNFNTEEAYERFSNKLRKMGLDEELIKNGIEEGDTVRILDFEFEWTR